MSQKPRPQPSAEVWFIPATTVQLPDGSTLVKPGKAILRATPGRTERLTGVRKRVLAALAECGLIRRDRPSPGSAFYYPGEVEALLARTASEPEFWDQVRTKAFLSGSNLKNADTR